MLDMSLQEAICQAVGLDDGKGYRGSGEARPRSPVPAHASPVPRPVLPVLPVWPHTEMAETVTLLPNLGIGPLREKPSPAELRRDQPRKSPPATTSAREPACWKRVGIRQHSTQPRDQNLERAPPPPLLSAPSCVGMPSWPTTDKAIRSGSTAKLWGMSSMIRPRVKQAFELWGTRDDKTWGSSARLPTLTGSR